MRFASRFRCLSNQMCARAAADERRGERKSAKRGNVFIARPGKSKCTLSKPNSKCPRACETEGAQDRAATFLCADALARATHTHTFGRSIKPDSRMCCPLLLRTSSSDQLKTTILIPLSWSPPYRILRLQSPKSNVAPGLAFIIVESIHFL